MDPSDTLLLFLDQQSTSPAELRWVARSDFNKLGLASGRDVEFLVSELEDLGLITELDWGVLANGIPQTWHCKLTKAGREHAAELRDKTDPDRGPVPVIPKVDALLLTVNPHETQALLQVFQQATKSPATPITVDDRVYRDLGTVNGTRVFHALSEMGSGGPGATQQTADKAIRALRPGAIVAVGIAFGINEKKQAIGDILLSKQLRLYDLQRAGSTIILRGERPHASTRLINYFEGVAQSSWQGASVKPGLILSGEKLVDDLDYRNQLTGFEPEAIGGEMEGAGLYVACQEHKVDWIVIKAICDWGDGHKSKNKTARQKKAAQSAAAFVLHALQQVAIL